MNIKHATGLLLAACSLPLTALTGDTNSDGLVNDQDFFTGLLNYERDVTGKTLATGDVSGDGITDIRDLLIIVGNTTPTSTSTLEQSLIYDAADGSLTFGGPETLYGYAIFSSTNAFNPSQHQDIHAGSIFQVIDEGELSEVASASIIPSAPETTPRSLGSVLVPNLTESQFLANIDFANTFYVPYAGGGTLSLTPVYIPEPTSAALFTATCFILASRRRRSK